MSSVVKDERDRSARTWPCPYEAGETFERRVYLDRDSVSRVAALLGDNNPLHHDEPFACGTRFSSLIASGAQCTGLLVACVGTFMTQKGAGLGLEFSFRLRKAVPSNEDVLIRWEITSVTFKESLEGYVAKLSGELRLADDTVAITATAESLILRLEDL